MTHRERFMKTMLHQQPDRPPIDFNGTCLTSCHEAFLKNFLKFHQISAENDQDAVEQLMRRYDIDFRRVGMLFEPESPCSDYSRMAQGEYTDCWGIVRRNTGTYWDIVKSPLKGADFEEIRAFPWPSAGDIPQQQIDECTEKAKRLYEDTDYVVVAEHPVYGYFELGCWMFGFDDFLYRCMAEPETVDYFFRRYHEYVAAVCERYYGSLGRYIHVTTSGDDFGMQNGPFVSPQLFTELIAPWYQKRIALTKSLCGVKYFHHSCGSVYRLLRTIIDVGVDILNPIQPGAYEMEPERLKQDFGNEIVFWGGIDEQHLLSGGTPEQIRQEVRRIAGIMNRDGGYVMAASHNLQPDIPPENADAMLTALTEL